MHVSRAKAEYRKNDSRNNNYQEFTVKHNSLRQFHFMDQMYFIAVGSLDCA
jgi:hypothetical protein